MTSELPISAVPRVVDLGDDGTLVLRIGGTDDLAAVRELYGRLSASDLERRFFSARLPPDRAIERWLSGSERGGLVLLAEATDADSTRLIAEGGYALLPDGDGELGITVDPLWRGWVGPWLLDAIATEAAARGVANLEAEVLVANKPMRMVFQRRGHAVVDHPDWQHVRLVVSTTGSVPTWPDTEARHLLAVAPGGRWSGEDTAQQLGFEVRTCPGPGGRRSPCPLLDGGSCPLLAGADAIVWALPADDPNSDELVSRYRAQRPDAPTIVIDRSQSASGRSPCETAADVLATITAALPG